MAPSRTRPRMRRRDSAMDVADVLGGRNKIDPKRNNEGLDIKVLGVCTGSGLQKVNCALVRYRQDAPNKPLRVELIQYSEVPVPSTKRLPILNTFRDAQTKHEAIAYFNTLLGHMFSTGIKSFCQTHDIALTSIDLVGTHTPTALKHSRVSTTDVSIVHPFGWNTRITSETGITAAFNFAIVENAIIRPHIIPNAFVDKLFLRHPTKFRACLNIGELATLSFIPPLVDSDVRGTICQECGPGSLLIDYAVRYCSSNSQSEDHDGELAAPGRVEQDVVDRFLFAHDYLRTPPPLNIAREMFGDHEAQRLIDECLFLDMSEADTIATITRVSAQNILKQYHRLLAFFFPKGQEVDELFICGPSARNTNIIDYLESKLPESVITKPLEDIGIPGDANEAISYAHLALEAVLGQVSRSVVPSPRTSSLPTADTIRARIICGNRWNVVVGKVRDFSDGTQLDVAKEFKFANKSKNPPIVDGVR